MNGGMIHDLRTILDGWEYEPGKISVRKIIGRDGREKIQTRVDLGLLQLETTGRPDGRRPEGHDSYLAFCEDRLRRHRERGGDDDDFRLSPEICRELRHEAHLYYQRFLSLFVLEEFDAVERDTGRNLRVFDLCRDHAAEEQDRAALEPQRAYVMMMNTRARVYGALHRNDPEAALAQLDAGLARLMRLWRSAADADPAASPPELQVLQGLRREVLDGMPPDSPPRLQAELDAALEVEDYERAARLRDRLTRTAGARSVKRH